MSDKIKWQGLSEAQTTEMKKLAKAPGMTNATLADYFNVELSFVEKHSGIKAVKKKAPIKKR